MSTTRGKVLAVDDEDLNRQLLQAILEEAGYEVVTAKHGAEALDRLGEQEFDTVLLDLRMPRMNGYEVLERMQADENMRHIPVIVISAVDAIESVARCIEMGATDYLTKPFNSTVLWARINASLTNKRMHDMEQAYLERLSAEQKRSEQLLLNILPEPIAEQLKQGQSVIAEIYPDVTVLFADLVGFTAYSLRTSAENVVDTLNTIFSAYDAIVERHGLEKIKSMGDAYMVAGGVPVTRSDHAEAVAALALDFQTKMAELVQQKRVEPLQIRIGIQSGSVVAGVIGTKKFSFDMWGDTVNTAYRMQTSAPTGAILTTDTTYARLKDEYSFEEHGVIEVKGKGKVMTYVLTGKKKV